MIRLEQVLNATRQVAPKILGVLLLAAVIVPNSAEAVLMEAEVSFTANGFVSTPANTVPPSDPVSGSFSFQFDDSGVTGSDIEEFQVPLIAISLSFGGINFSLDDANAEIAYIDGVPVSISAFGLLEGVIVSSVSSRPDFLFITNIESMPPEPNFFTYALPGLTAFFDAETVVVTDFSFQEVSVPVSVPEPATLALLSLGLVGFGAMKRRDALRRSTR